MSQTDQSALGFHTLIARSERSEKLGYKDPKVGMQLFQARVGSLCRFWAERRRDDGLRKKIAGDLLRSIKVVVNLPESLPFGVTEVCSRRHIQSEGDDPLQKALRFSRRPDKTREGRHGGFRNLALTRSALGKKFERRRVLRIGSGTNSKPTLLEERSRKR